ncbi:uncharacterized protein LOC134337552 [Mobula hypostoma]|uniref:uncharacterized protein LOC134337552 n=1 Tax=Mobula hypostoma TaxID=723540 RepID=UPI002FC27E1C
MTLLLDSRPNQFPSTTTLLCLAELVLTLNNFSFGSSHFLQTKGVAMSTRMGPSYACLFVGFVEPSMFQTYTGICPHFSFATLMTALVLLPACMQSSLTSLILPPTFTLPSSLPGPFPTLPSPFLIFLSLPLETAYLLMSTISLRTLTATWTIPFAKMPSPSHNSSVSAACALRMRLFIPGRRRCPFSFFKERGFPSSTINSVLKRISPISRTSALTPSSCHPTRNRIPLVLIYHPASFRVQHIILRNFRHLQRDPTTKHIFPSPPPHFLLSTGIAPYTTPLSICSPHPSPSISLLALTLVSGMSATHVLTLPPLPPFRAPDSPSR